MISFRESHNLTSDDKLICYRGFHWKRNSHSFPISYNIGQKMKVTLEVTFPGAQPEAELFIRATDVNGAMLMGDEIALTQQKKDPEKFRLIDHSFDKNISDVIKHYSWKTAGEEFTITWAYYQKTDDPSLPEIGIGFDVTKHTLYETHDKPLARKVGVLTRIPRQESIFELSCRYADEMKVGNVSAENGDVISKLDIAKRIFVPFTALEVPKVKPTFGVLQEVPMTYYDAEGGGSCATGARMLADESGNGVCSAWATLLLEILGSHGWKGELKEVQPAVAQEKLVVVKHVTLGDPSDGLDVNFPEYKYKGNSNFWTQSPDENGGIYGQGSSKKYEPPKIFFNHFIAEFENTIFDPSYESTPVVGPNRIKDFEDRSFALYGVDPDIADDEVPESDEDLANAVFRRNNTEQGSGAEVKLITSEF